jgi:hypothetical protein
MCELDPAGPIPDTLGMTRLTTPARQRLQGRCQPLASRRENRGWLAENGITDTVAAGSSLKFCLLAEGKAHLYPRFGRTMEWDTAAGHAVLAAAGGSVVVAGATTPLTYGKQERGFRQPRLHCQRGKGWHLNGSKPRVNRIRAVNASSGILSTSRLNGRYVPPVVQSV